ncbi:hypothetical protein LX64_02405 [Chitinophaga skermanii]|uniref:DUF4760 domain-containing protein n=1 Tax=Chitinophaga skermanii TaxID=331697 RepID=A0A327QLQ7_9BACT|nr:hypothetical protein [Chitinophaga skermanii]RAJ05250.1 hypothetical protein LX64_02405 [Chitinophaga skermanii]
MNQQFVTTIMPLVIAIISLLGTVIVIPLQSRKERKLQEKRRQDELDEKEETIKREGIKDAIRANEAIYLLVSKIQHTHSVTSNLIDAELQLPLVECYARHMVVNEELNRVHMFVTLDYPAFAANAGMFSAAVSNFWGMQQLLLQVDEKQNKEKYYDLFNAVIKAGIEVSKHGYALKDQLATATRELRGMLSY